MATTSLSLRPAAMTDLDFLLRIRCEPSNIHWTGHATAPERAGLEAWLTAALANPAREVLIAIEGGEPVGYLYQDQVDDGFEVSIGISEKAGGRGLATRSLGLLVAAIRRDQPNADVFAWVLDHNEASLKVFTRNDFSQTPVTRVVDVPLEQGSFQMHRMVYDHTPDLEIGGFFATDPGIAPPKTSVLRAFPIDQTTWYGDGRQAILAILLGLPGGSGRCFVPAYICASVIQPFTQQGLEVTYYGHKAPLDPILPEVGRGDLVLIDDAFGALRVSEERIGGLVASGAQVILDVTHSLFSTERLKHRPGVTMVASLRKSLPVADGGVAISDQTLPEAGPPAESVAMREAMTAKAAYLDGRGGEQVKAIFLATYHAHEETKDRSTIRLTGPPSDLLATLGSLDLRAIIARRQANLEYLEGALPDSTLLLFPPGTIANPFMLPLVFPDSTARDAAKSALSAEGIYPPIHWPLPSPPDFTYEHDLSARILSLPLDQRYHPADLVRTVRVLEDLRT